MLKNAETIDRDTPVALADSRSHRYLAVSGRREVCLALILVWLFIGPKASDASTPPWRLVFWDAADVTNVVSPLEFKAEPLVADGHATGFPNMQFGCEVPRADGRSWIYGWSMATSRVFHVIRCVTTDGLSFDSTETVFSYTNNDANWQGYANIVYRPSDQSQFLFSWSNGQLYVFNSNNGEHWTLLTSKAYTGHDAMCVTWYPPFNKFLNYQTYLQSWPKRYPDNIKNNRRVISFRSSSDGVAWQTLSPPFLHGQTLLTPDADDPIDLEFYRGLVFPFDGRYAMLLQDYIPSPKEANPRSPATQHSPMGHAEWAISRDGLNWERTFRAFDPKVNVGWLTLQGPLTRNGVLRFYLPSGRIASLTDGRIFYVTSQGNAEFSTPPFTMPTDPLFLNADISYLPYEGKIGRAYVMAELRGADNQVISGFERTNCVLQNLNSPALPLHWSGNDGRTLVGRQVSLHFYLRDAKIYDVHSEAISVPAR